MNDTAESFHYAVFNNESTWPVPERSGNNPKSSSRSPGAGNGPRFSWQCIQPLGCIHGAVSTFWGWELARETALLRPHQRGAPLRQTVSHAPGHILRKATRRDIITVISVAGMTIAILAAVGQQ